MKKFFLLVFLGTLLVPVAASAQGLPTITLGLGQANNPQQVSTALQVLFVLTILSMAPAILLMTTAFIRIVIVLSFVRQAMGTQQMPPNQVIIGLALFLTFFIMTPVLTKINNNALQPYLKKQIGQQQALERAVQPMRQFMLSQAREKDVALLMNITGRPQPKNQADVSDHGPHPRLHAVGADAGVSDRLYDLSSLSGDRYGGRVGADVDGHDDAAAGHYLSALQAAALRSGQRVGSGSRLAGPEFSLKPR